MKAGWVLKGAFVSALAIAAPIQVQAASNEVPLRIHAIGSARADQVQFSFSLQGSGESKAAADAEIEKQEADLIQGLREIGVIRSRVTITPRVYDETNYGYTGSAWDTGVAIAVDAAADTADAAAAAASVEAVSSPGDSGPSYWTVTSNADVSLTFEEAERSQGAINLPSAYYSGSRPQFSFSDQEKSHREAIVQAVANARIQADAYAAAMGYRVVRVTGVTNGGSPISAHELVSMVAKIDNPSRDWSLIGTISAPVTVDYVIAPE